jgi:hypothetical protein
VLPRHAVSVFAERYPTAAGRERLEGGSAGRRNALSSFGAVAPQHDRAKYVDVSLYASAAVSYVVLSIYFKWLLAWIVGPLWLLGWVWGLPALWRLARGRPVRPPREHP